MTQNEPTKSGIAQELMKPHPGRLFLLGGAWSAIIVAGVFGIFSLVNPAIKLPLIDPLFAKFASKLTTITAAKKVVKPVVKPSESKPLPAATKPNVTKQPKPAIKPAALVTESPATATKTAKPSTPQPKAKLVPTGSLPPWIYVVGLASCLSGSSLITYMLYQASQQKPQPPKARPSQKQTKVRVPVKNAVQPSLKTSHKKRKPQAKSRVAPQPQFVTANAVTANSAPAHRQPDLENIAPLKISTPPLVAPPRVKLEPVIDPQPVEKTELKAAHLTAIAQKAKQTVPQTLVESVDIRRRGSLAPLLQDL